MGWWVAGGGRWGWVDKKCGGELGEWRRGRRREKSGGEEGGGGSGVLGRSE